MNAGTTDNDGVVARAAMEPRMANSTALDQWRGFALILVLISHGFYFTNRVHGIGRVGVNLFFFISGILVFRSLSQLQQQANLPLASSFLKRRFRRLYPALLSYVIVMFGVDCLLRNIPGALTLGPRQYLDSTPFALLYVINYLPFEGPMSLGHLWSIACEMQFYVLSPFIFLLGGKTTARNNLIWGGISTLLIAVGFAGALFDRTQAHKYHFEVAVWPMMLGFYCEHRRSDFVRLPAIWARRMIRGSLVLFVAMTVVMLRGYEMKKPVVAIGAAALIPCYLGYVTNLTLNGRMGRLLTWLGERTYSIYLWQQPFTICRYLPDLLHPIGAVAAMLVGGAWFNWFEQPFLSSKRKHTPAER